MSVPNQCHMQELSCNIEGLRKHKFMCVFIPEDDLTPLQMKWRSWFLHSLVSASRSYNEARNVILGQIRDDQSRSHVASFRIMDFGEKIENCVSALYRMSMCARKLESKVPSLELFGSENAEAITAIGKLRNQHDHMYQQIVSGEIGSGPIIYAISKDGKGVSFRRLTVEFSVLKAVIEALYKSICCMFPGFNADSAPEAAGAIGLSLTATVESRVIKK